MKKIKFVICCLSFILLTGCNAEVNLVMDTKGNIHNNTKFTVNKSFMDNMYNNTDEIKDYYNNLILEYDNKFKLKVNYEKDLVVAKISKKSNINSLNGLENILIKDVTVNNNSYVITFNDLTEYFNPDLEIDVETDGLLESLNINIQFFNKVVNSNSTFRDDKKNTYTWSLTKEDFNKTLEFTLSDEKRYDIIFQYLLNKYIGAIVLLSIIVVITSSILLIVLKSRKSNQL